MPALVHAQTGVCHVGSAWACCLRGGLSALPWFSRQKARVAWAVPGPAASGGPQRFPLVHALDCACCVGSVWACCLRGTSVLPIGSRVRRRVLRGLCVGLLPPGDLSASPWFTRQRVRVAWALRGPAASGGPQCSHGCAPGDSAFSMRAGRSCCTGLNPAVTK